MELAWESEIALLLGRLSEAQDQLLDLLAKKRNFLVQRDQAGLSALLPQEEALCAELQACHDQRQELLVKAGERGLPADSIRSLANALPGENAQILKQPMDEAERRSHLLRHQCLAQWVAVQRTMLHLSHMVEIIATGGQLQPTYGKGSATTNSGALMDQAV